MILMDWQRGKIPFFVPPPSANPDEVMEPKVAENTNKNVKIYFDIVQN